MILGYVVNERAKFLKRLIKTEKKLEYSYRELTDLYEGLMVSFAKALDAKSPWTRGHSERVTAYSILTAKEMNLDEKHMATLRTAALLHDIGKIGIGDGILDKPGKLTIEEFKCVMMHPGDGEEILKSIEQFEEVRTIIRHHHEHVNGCGYPDRLKGGEIHLLARVICVADSFDSMTADRPYRRAPGREYAISELQMCSGMQFDSEVVNAFLRANTRQEKIEGLQI